MTTALFQVNGMAISQGRQNSTKKIKLKEVYAQGSPKRLIRI